VKPVSRELALFSLLRENANNHVSVLFSEIDKSRLDLLIFSHLFIISI